MKNSVLLLMTSFFAFLLTSCAPSEYVKVAVDFGVPIVKKQTFPLTSTLPQLFSVTPGQDCSQDQLELVVYDNDLDQVIDTKKVVLRSLVGGTPPVTSDAFATDIDTFITRLQSYSFLDEAPSILVPKGRNVEIGLGGTFYNPVAGNIAVPCMQRSSSLAVANASIIGHASVTSNVISAGAIQLNLHVVVANPTNNYDGGGGRADIAAFPNKKDFIQIDGGAMINSLHSLTVTAIKWLQNPQGQFTIHQDLNTVGAWSSGFTQKFYVPHLFPAKIQMTYAGSNSSGCSSSTAPCAARYEAFVPKDPSSGMLFTFVKVEDVTATTSPPTIVSSLNFITF